eukprot:GHVN01005486.1.p1 GENE.GHVN01005486.1~~GHVN01005486.1.p1  ORF type:complete len:155 (+),score=21.82 GHVN01005486.1:59-523(+)
MGHNMRDTAALLLICMALTSPHAKGANCPLTSHLVGKTIPFYSETSGLKGDVTVVDDCTLVVHEFSMNGGPAVYFRALDLQLRVSSMHLEGTYDKESFVVDLDEGYDINDFEALAVYCEEYKKIFGWLYLPPPRAPRGEEDNPRYKPRYPIVFK